MLTTVIIPAAGRGHRFGGSSTPKQYQMLSGRPVLWHTLRCFEDSPLVQAIVVAIHADDIEAFEPIATGFSKLRPAVFGGAERVDSVTAGLAAATGGACGAGMGAVPGSFGTAPERSRNRAAARAFA